MQRVGESVTGQWAAELMYNPYSNCFFNDHPPIQIVAFSSASMQALMWYTPHLFN